MGWLKKLFSTDRKFVGDFIETGDDLLSLVASNQVVRAEYDLFLEKAKQSDSDIKYEAHKSADALSGYGIAVKPKALIDTLEV